jgi:hypothetical protein
MDIDAAGVASPAGGRIGGAGCRRGAGVVLLNANFPDAKAGGPQGSQQLMAVVLQGLQPGARRRSDAEHPTAQLQRAAMGRQLGAGEGGPGLPEGGLVTLLLPVLAQFLEAAGQRLGRLSGRR